MLCHMSVHLCLQVILSHGRPRLTFPLPPRIRQSSPVVAIEDDGSVRFQDGSLHRADVLMFCTGYNFKYPFLDADQLGLKIQDHMVSPLYRFLMPPAFPSLFFIGICKIICPFPNFNCQVQFALAVLDGSVTLPPRAEMEDETRQELQDKVERGVEQRHLLILEQDQWEYCQMLAHAAGFPPLPPVVRSLYEEVWRQRQIHPENYRSLNYRLVSDTRWELVQ
nr:PREDICTED: flavin-containing monooxygenase FMO GS-OX-like 3 [Paralichthys olivaceus]